MMLFDTYHFKTKRAFFYPGSTISPISIAEVVVTFDKGESYFHISKPKEPFTMSNTRPAR